MLYKRLKKFNLNENYFLAFLTIICLLPFLDKAFHIDDPLFLWTAEHILKSPFDFYNFAVNWNGWLQPMHEINKNPPFAAYYIALVAKLFGWAEITLHTAFLIPAVALSLGIFQIAKRLCRHSKIAVLVSIFTPAYLVSASNLMTDTLMVSMYVWTIALWIIGLEKQNNYYLLFSMFICSFAVLTKYFAISAVPLLLVYTLYKHKTLKFNYLFLLIPVATLLGFHYYSLKLYGHSLVFDAVHYAQENKTNSLEGGFFGGLTFAGGCLLGSLFFLPFLWRWRQALLLVILGAVTFLVYENRHFQIHYMSGWHQSLPNYEFILQILLFLIAGLQLLILAIDDFFRNRTAESLLLFLVCLGTFCFFSFLNWTINARTILPLVIVCGILVVRRLEFLSPMRIHLKAIFPLAFAFLLAFGVAWSDYKWANSAKEFAHRHDRIYRGNPNKIWFTGHWGFQFYMEKVGASSFDLSRMGEQLESDAEDVLVNPTANTSTFKGLGSPIQVVLADTFPWITTQKADVGAGFYSNLWGPLPYYIGAGGATVFNYYKMIR